jgi:NAD(P)-dependent dehydrogenase (short-subunit alcohol dehydrogenase family)
MTSRLCEDRVVVISGAGRGIGRAHAVALAEAGAKIVINDIGASLNGVALAEDPASTLAAEISHAGGHAVANHDDVSTEEGARNLIDQAISEFGTLDVVINNAGIIRDSMIFNMTASDFDAVLKVHLRSTFLTSHYASTIWRDRAKAGQPVDARIINTTSVAGLYGNVGQTNYGSAKAAIAAFTIIASTELDRYGVTVNAISPGAATRMTEKLLDAARAADISPEHVAKVAVWLASPQSRGVTGRIIHVEGRKVGIPEGWTHGPQDTAAEGAGSEEIGEMIERLVAQARPNAAMDGSIPEVADAAR